MRSGLEPHRARVRRRADRQPLPSDHRGGGQRGGRCGLGRGDPLLRHGAALRSRPVRAPTRPGLAGLPARRLRRVDQGRPVAGAVAARPSEPDPEGFAVPATHRRVRDYSRDGVLRSIEASLDRLGLDRIDLVLIHDPGRPRPRGLEAAAPALSELRAEGVIRGYGAGMNQSAMLTRFVRETDVDVVMVAGPLHPAGPERAVTTCCRLPRAGRRRDQRRHLQLRLPVAGRVRSPRPGSTTAPSPAPLTERTSRLALRLRAVRGRPPHRGGRRSPGAIPRW